MEKNNWIETILNSTNGLTPVVPSDNLFSKIQAQIKNKNKVSEKIIWLVAASVAVLVVWNCSVLSTKTKENKTSTTTYFENELNKSNQLYQ